MNSPQNHDTELGSQPPRRWRRDEENASPSLRERGLPQADVPEQRIRHVFGLSGNTSLPRVSHRTLQAYYQHLAGHLSFPFLARYWEEVSPLESVCHIVTVLRLADPERQRAEASSGIRCVACVENRTVELPLAELELHNGTGNSRLIEDYWYWLWNWRSDAGA